MSRDYIGYLSWTTNKCVDIEHIGHKSPPADLSDLWH